MKYGFGIDLGGTTVKLALFEEGGTLLHKWEIPTNTADSGSHILPDIADAVTACAADRGIHPTQLLGIGIGVPGPVAADGTVNRCVNLGWGVFNIAEELRGLTGLPVKAGNDANVAALGEAWKGSGLGCENMILVTLGTGVGGGIILGGKILHGAHGSGGEIGHMVLNPNETEVCGCGKRGCVEQYCSATGIVRLARKQLAEGKLPTCLSDTPDLTCKAVLDAAQAGDPLAAAVRATVCDYLARAIADLCTAIDPEAVVIGGGVSRAGQPLLEGIAARFPQYVFHGAADVRFALASLGNDAGVYGAFRLLLP